MNTRFARAIQLLGENKVEDALAIAKDLLEEYPNSSAIAGFIGEIYYLEFESPERALPFFYQTVNLSPTSKRASMGLYHCLWDLGEEEKAVSEIRRFLTLSPDSQAYDEIISGLEKLYS